MNAKPRVTVAIEGYNESRELGNAVDTLEALARQEFPLDQVEVLLFGSPAQTAAWRAAYAEDAPFQSLRTIDVEGANYYELKNLGAREARADIVALTDSDVVPQPRWLASIVEAVEDGAELSAGLSFFKTPGSWRHDTPTRLVASSITWGWNVGKGSRPGPAGFMDHNVGFRTETLRAHPYPAELGRTRAATLLLHALAKSGADLRLQPHQKCVHSFGWFYWLKLHYRYGYEVYEMRRLDPLYPNRWITRAGPLEPLATLAWHMLLDVPRWFRVCRLVPVHPLRRWALLPLLVAMSALARGAEAVGMVRTMIAPEAMARWADSM